MAKHGLIQESVIRAQITGHRFVLDSLAFGLLSVVPRQTFPTCSLIML